jgi:Cu(I)/Ag(I) efflux system membrane fusion protein
MAGVRWLLLAAVTGLAAYSLWSFWWRTDGDRHATASVRFYCPMHPEVRSAQPGECPICHMNLEPIPEERRADPQTQAAASDRFYCPMHPEVRAHDPGECPICHMKLEPIPEERKAGTGKSASGDVEHVVSVDIAKAQQNHIGIATSQAKASDARGSLRVPAVLSAPETGRAEVRTRAAGFIERVIVRQSGERVQRGQVLAYIYSPEIYRAQEEFLAATRWGAQRRSPADATTASIAAAARRSLELLGLTPTDIDELGKRSEPLRAVPLRAPIGGYVTRFNAVLGSRADSETVLYELADLSSLWVIASVHERDAAQIRVGMNAEFRPAGDSAAPLQARVALIEPQLDENNRQSRVRLGLRNDGHTLRPGQYGEVSFELPARRGLFVPRDAVIDTGLSRYVYVQTGDERFEPRAVDLGPQNGELVEIRTGLRAGERVVTRGNFMLDSESRLRASLTESTTVVPPEPAREATPERAP